MYRFHILLKDGSSYGFRGHNIDTAFIFSTIAPIFLIILLGVLLKRWGVINANFISISSKLVFNLTLPSLIFLKVSSLDSSTPVPFSIVAIIVSVTVGVFIVTWLIASKWIASGTSFGAFMQGSYRGNFATVGLAASAGVYGVDGLLQAALLLAFIVPVYNILGVIALVVPLGQEHQLSRTSIAKELFLNPIVLAVVIALPFAYFDLSLPLFIQNTGNYLAELTIPLALIGVGGTLQFVGRDYSFKQALSASLIKVMLLPSIGMAVAMAFGFRGQDLGILFIFFACPTTMATFIMAQAMGADDKLASAIVVISTCLSSLTILIGFFMFQHYFQ